MGELLDHRWDFQLDYCAVAHRLARSAEPADHFVPCADEKCFLEFSLWDVVGSGRGDVRADGAVSWLCAGHGDGAGILRSFWNLVAPDFQRRIWGSDQFKVWAD